MTQLDQPAIDTALLDLAQEEIPLVPRPYAEMARRLDASHAVVLDRLGALHCGPTSPIRQIGAIFDSKALGYQSTLVAVKVPEAQLPAAAAVINKHPGVSHNYRREHEYNLWFTLAVPPDSRLGLLGTVQALHSQSGAISMRMLPTLKMYKIGVKLDLGSGRTERAPAPARSQASSMVLTPHMKKIIRVLQQDLPIVAEPFQSLAAEAGVSVTELLATAEVLRRQGIMRRFSAVLRHRELGFDANAMGVWVVPPGKEDAFGRAAAAFPEVSHCYLRPTYPDWPYNIFTMIHARQEAQAAAVLAAISDATGITRYSVLYSTREYKKIRVRYFEPDIPQWEAEVEAGTPA